jgi:diaminohydroxyphosphoribosylaminopyrimidine deaminase/5-amino-6-(5-phosphoribosylamino)uracil reductase
MIAPETQPRSADAFVRLMLALARRGLGRTWPNPSVGAVIVNAEHDQILGRGTTSPGGRPHAEIVALAGAGETARGGTLYVTLEPCAHHGVTPPCADAIIRAGLAEVVYGLVDPDPRVSGEGLSRLKRHGVTVRQGNFSDEARWLTLGHTLRTTQNRPFVQVKLAVGADGLVPAGGGAPVWVTSAQARGFAHLLRTQADAIAVGRATITADNPQLTCRLPGLESCSPVRIVFAGNGGISPASRLFADIASVPVWIIRGAKAPWGEIAGLKNAGAKLITSTASRNGRLDILPALAQLASEGITRLFVEGGPSLVTAFLDAGVADEIFIFHGARPAGLDGIRPFGREGLERLDNMTDYALVEKRPFGPDTVATYRRILPPLTPQTFPG